MSTHAQDFGLLRSLVQRPSTLSWRRICGLLDRYWLRWETPFVREQMVPYLEGHLDHWPRDLLRYAQHAWVHDAMCGRDVPQMAYATAMHFVSQEITDARLRALSRSPYLGRMRRIDFERGFDQGRVLDLLGAKSIGALEWLDLGSVRLELEALELFAHACPRVRVLDLTATHPRVLEVLEPGLLPELETLTIARNNLYDRQLLNWAESGSFERLEMLDLSGNRFSHRLFDQLGEVPGWKGVCVRWDAQGSFLEL